MEEIGAGTSAGALESYLRGSTEVVLDFDCCGGSADEGVRIYEVLRRHPNTTGIVTGLCASSAVDVLQGCRRRLAHVGSKLLLHGVSSACFGTQEELRHAADSLAELDQRSREFYQRHTGQSAEVVAGWFSGGDHYLCAAEAFRLGLVDGVFDDFTGYPQRLVAPPPSFSELLPVSEPELISVESQVEA